MGYLPYYLLSFFGAYLLRYPYLALGAVAVYLLRRWVPDPYLYLKHAARVRALKAQIAQNRENVTARRDLAKVWLEKGRPRRALPLLAEARARDAASAELAFLQGKALLLAGRAEEALEPLVAAALADEKLYYGEPYLVAGRALYALGRHAEAEDAFARYVRINSSTVEGRVRLACARREQRDKPGTRDAMREAFETYSHIPRFRRRKELLWYLRARLMTLGLA